MRSLNSDWFLQKIGQIWVESNNCEFYVCLTDSRNGDDTTYSITSYCVAKSLASSAQFGTLKPGTLKQSQFRSLVVKAASVVAPKVCTTCSFD